MTLVKSRLRGSDTAANPVARPGRRSGIVDPRLLRSTRGTRGFLVLTVVLGGVTAGLVLAQAWLIANTISDVVEDRWGVAQVRMLVILLLVVIVARSSWRGSESEQRSAPRPPPSRTSGVLLWRR